MTTDTTDAEFAPAIRYRIHGLDLHPYIPSPTGEGTLDDVEDWTDAHTEARLLWIDRYADALIEELRARFSDRAVEVTLHPRTGGYGGGADYCDPDDRELVEYIASRVLERLSTEDL